MILKYIVSALAILTVVSGGFAWYADKKLSRQADQIETLQNQLANCSARMGKILEDAKDDATVGDPSLFDVPDGWLLPSPGAGTGG
ncbi:MAG TPA: hypothetical protein VIG24_13300, partial [Acidimicrobiia bacterium]